MAEPDVQAAEPVADAPDKKDKKKAKGGSKMKLVLPLLLLLPAAAGGGLTYAHYGAVARVAAAVVGDDAAGEAEDDGGADAEAPADDEAVAYGEFYELTNLIVNPAESEGRRYLMVALALEASDGAALAEAEEKQIVVRDVVIRALSELTVEDLADITYRPILKEDLLGDINAVLEAEVDRLYFTQYVLQ